MDGRIDALEENLRSVERSIASLTTEVQLLRQSINALMATINDHENRIRHLERTIWVGFGIVSSIAFLAPYFWKLFFDGAF
jgi:prefoldin subunit 5